MFRRIVVAYNAGNEGRDALALATRLARLDRARIVVVQAMPLAAGPNVAREAATRMTAARASIAQVVAPDVEVEYRPFLTGEFAASVHAIAAREDAALVVAGQSRRGPLARARLGGGAELLLAGSRWPVVVAPPDQAQRPPFDPRVIGVGFDGSPGAALALRAAAGLARRFAAGLRGIAVGGGGGGGRAPGRGVGGGGGGGGGGAPGGGPRPPP